MGDELTVSEAAAELGMSVRGVRSRIERGQMASVLRHARLRLIPREEVERWKALGRQQFGPKRKAEKG